MKRYLPTLGTCLVLLFVSPTLAGDLANSKSRCCNTQRSCCPPPIAGCPDDYCRKPIPCIPCLPPSCACDDYCRKSLPCVPCLSQCGLCDDYCRKPFPNFCWPPSPGLRCVPSCLTSGNEKDGKAPCNTNLSKGK
jgi:hypothetical protein